MDVNQRIAELEALARRQFAHQFEGQKRAEFLCEQLKRLVREFAYREASLTALPVRRYEDL